MCEYLGSEGVTSFCGTTMAFDEPILTNILTVAKPYIGKETGGAVLRGVNMEGPFINKAKKGAQAVMTLETDLAVPAPLLDELRGLPGIMRVVPIPANRSV